MSVVSSSKVFMNMISQYNSTNKGEKVSSNKLTYDENVDVSGLDKEQTEVVSRYKTLIQSKKDFVNVEMIDKDG